MSIKMLARVMAKRPKTVILLFTVFTLLIGLQIRNLYMESDISKYLPKDDPTLQLWNKINEEFNLGSTIIILINQTGRGYKINTPEVLKEMDEIYRVLYEYPLTEGRENGIYSVTSLSTYIRKENAKAPPIEIGGGRGEDDIPDSIDDIYNYMSRELIYNLRGILYTNDFNYAVMIVRVKEGANFDDVLKEVENAINNRGVKHAQMIITGTIAMQKANQKQAMQSFLLVFPLAILLTSVVLFYFHRTLKGILIVFLPIMYALILTFGTLGAVLPELSMISVAIVALLIGLGVDYSIYLISRMNEERNLLDNSERIEKVLRSTGKAILLSAITTIIGFSSIMISSMFPLVSFGFGCVLGITYCLISATIIVPCLVILLNFEFTVKVPTWSKFARFVIKNGKYIVLIGIFFAILSIALIPKVGTNTNYYDMAPKGVKETEAMFLYSEKFGTGGNFNAFLVETEPYGLEDPEVINKLFEIEEIMRARDSRISVSSIADSIKRVYDIIDKNTVLKGLEELTDIESAIFSKIAKEGIINEDHSKTLIVVSIPVGLSTDEVEKIVNELNEIAEREKLPRNGRISLLTGQDAITVAVNSKLRDQQTTSMAIALILVLAVLILGFGSTRYGLITLLPVFFVLMWEPGFLVATGIPLSPVIVTVASIVIGTGIDYGIHMTHRFREEISRGLSKNDALVVTIEKTGLPLIEAATTTCAGITAVAIANIVALNQFVVVIVFMVFAAFIASVTILSAFLKTLKLEKQ